jgi:hypothetical protein
LRWETLRHLGIQTLVLMQPRLHFL